MALVVDTSEVIACVLGEPERDPILATVTDQLLVAPMSLTWEMGNAMSAGFKRGRFTLDAAVAALDLYRQMPITLRPVDLLEAVKLAHRARIYAYDAYVIQCALDSGGR